MERLTPEQAAACDAWSKDGTEENWVQLARVRAGIYGFDSELLAERILDLLDLLQQAEQDRDTLAAEVQMWRDHDHWEGVCDHDPPQCAVCRVVDATDASGALARSKVVDK